MTETPAQIQKLPLARLASSPYKKARATRSLEGSKLGRLNAWETPNRKLNPAFRASGQTLGRTPERAPDGIPCVFPGSGGTCKEAQAGKPGHALIKKISSKAKGDTWLIQGTAGLSVSERTFP
jgi:hypothetical protein